MNADWCDKAETATAVYPERAAHQHRPNHLLLKAAAELPDVAATSVHPAATVGLPVAAVALLAAAVGEPVAAVAARQLRQKCSQKQKVKKQ